MNAIPALDLLYAAGFTQDKTNTRLQFKSESIEVLKRVNNVLQAKILNPNDPTLVVFDKKVQNDESYEYTYKYYKIIVWISFFKMLKLTTF